MLPWGLTHGAWPGSVIYDIDGFPKILLTRIDARDEFAEKAWQKLGAVNTAVIMPIHENVGVLVEYHDPKIDPVVLARAREKMAPVVDEMRTERKKDDGYDDDETVHVLVYNTTDEEPTLEVAKRLSRKLFLVMWSLLRSEGVEVDPSLGELLDEHDDITRERAELAKARVALQMAPVPVAPPIKLPDNWKDAVTKEAMEEMVTAVARITESYNEFFLDVHHGNIPMNPEPLRFSLSQYAKFLEPKNHVDGVMGKFMDALDKLPAVEAPPPAMPVASVPRTQAEMQAAADLFLASMGEGASKRQRSA